MRITAGAYRNRQLFVPKGQNVRPTSDKVRQAIFNSLLSRVDISEASVLDAFCGSGALGLEALSRGAISASFIDRDTKAVQANISTCKADTQSHILRKDVTKAGLRPTGITPATLLFLDPPYRKDLVTPALQALHEGAWLADDCFCVIETEKEWNSALPENFTLQDSRSYGDSVIHYCIYSL